jgi:lysyl-tRNA synthetase class I
MTLDPNTYTFTTAANMIASQVTPKENNRSVSAVGKESVDKTKTDFLPVKKWRALSVEPQASIRAARDKDPEIKKKSQKQKSALDRRDRKIKNLQKKVSALQRQATKEAEDDDDSDNDDAYANAGSAFGGREEKKQAKKRNKK